MSLPPPPIDPGPIPNYPSIIGVTFKLSKSAGYVIRVNDGASIPIISDTPDSRQYAAWLAAGNVVLPADGPSVEDTAVTSAMTTRQATLTRITTNFPTSWTNFEQMVTDAINFKNIANNAWTVNNSRDACKLLINIAMFCCAKLLVLIIERQDRR